MKPKENKNIDCKRNWMNGWMEVLQKVFAVTLHWLHENN